MPVQAVIPSAPPPPPQINPPTGIIEGYLNRIPPAVYASQQIQNSLGALAQYQQQKQARQLEALKSISDLYGAGGPQAVQQYAPTLNRVAGSNIIDTSQDQAQSVAPSYSAPGGGGGVSSNDMSAPAQPAQTAPSPSNQGQPQTIGGQAQAPGISPYIQASLDAGHPDYTGQLKKLSSQMGSYQNQGAYGKNVVEGLSKQAGVTNELLSDQREREQFAENQAREKGQFDKTFGVTKGGKQAEAQEKFNTQNQKIMAGFKALQDLSDAWDRVPSNLKGPGIGTLTKGAGSIASGQAPELTSFNKIRDLAGTTLATALLPENARTNPQAVEEFQKNFPTAQSSPAEKEAVLRQLYSELANQAQLNYQGSQAAASATGGQITQPNIPKPNFGQPKPAKGASGPEIMNQAQLDALPIGTPYTFNGKPHVKRGS